MPFGQDPIFFDLLDKQASLAVQAAQQFAGLGKDFGGREKTAASLKALEDEADGLVHELVIKADAKFITPFDKEDFHALAHSLDDVTDFIEAAGSRVALYRLGKPRPDFAPLADLLRQSAEATAQAVGGLRHLKDHKEMVQTFTPHTHLGEPDRPRVPAGPGRPVQRGRGGPAPGDEVERNLRPHRDRVGLLRACCGHPGKLGGEICLSTSPFFWS